ncbi:MAG: tRNA (adenosine(37)-N6)-threonylcarbamoyltransferase complex dimerization subunit type 1 TsaB [bacterium]
MNILAIDTSSEATSVAVKTPDGVFDIHRLTPRKHTDVLLPMVDEVLAEAGVERSALTHVAFGRGPGSFTGVRIAVSVAQGIAYSLDAGIIPVSTLAALAQEELEASSATRVLSVIDARMNEVYAASYVRGESGIACLEGVERVCVPEQIKAPVNEPYVGVGSGWAVWGQSLAKSVGRGPERIETERLPRAKSMLTLARQSLKGETGYPLEDALPVYLRDKVAETTEERMQRKAKS